MKKSFIVLISILSIISISSLVIAISDDGTGVPNILLQIKEILLDMLEKLNIIAEKNMTAEVIVGPNITVSPPEVTVNPNITLPDKECKWEKLNQVIPMNTGLQQHGGVYGFVLPDSVEYSDVIFKRLSLLFQCKYSVCDIMFSKPAGEEKCLRVTGPNEPYRLFDVTDTCLQYLREGTNNVSIRSYSGNFGFKEIYVEMEIKSANC